MNTNSQNLPSIAKSIALADPSHDLNGYLRLIRSLPLLSAEEEMELARRYHEHQDLRAAEQLVLFNLRHVVPIVRSYKGYGLPEADLLQEGSIGLMKAVKRFDIGAGVRLMTFASHWIRAEINEYILKNWRMVKIATTKAQRNYRGIVSYRWRQSGTKGTACDGFSPKAMPRRLPNIPPLGL